MKTKLLILALFLLSINLNAQLQSPKRGDASMSTIITTPLFGEVNTPSVDLKWKPVLSTKCIGFKPQEPNEELIEKIKAEKLLLRNSSSAKKLGTENTTQAVTPAVGTNFLGNENNGSSPLDNSMAISNGGYIVSVANTTIEYDFNGSTVYYNDLVTFIGDPFITGVCDPVVIYDSGADRFVFFCQTCPIDANSKVLIFFSKTNNPNDGWWYYKFNGDPTGNGDGFDYPKIAVSNNELFIAGNLFYQPSGTFHQCLMYQIQKSNGYSGGNINWVYWYNLSGSPFTLLPVSSGQATNYGPGIYMVSTSSAGASNVNLYHITNDMNNSPTVVYNSVATTPYSVAPDADQLGTNCKLQTGDCRTLSGFYLNGIIHFVFHSDIGNGWHGINYNRLNISTLTNTSSMFGSSGSYDYCYPSVVSYATNANDKSVMIGFGRTSSAIFPEVRVVNCDNAMNWGPSILVKGSSSYVSYTSSSNERWGDYTGTARKHNSPTPSIWMNGMFGTLNNDWDTWISEIHDSGPTAVDNLSSNKSTAVFPNPVSQDFNVKFTLITSIPISIVVVDANGKLVKELFNGKANAGENFFSFNKANLKSGTYFLNITNETTTLKNEKIIISN